MGVTEEVEDVEGGCEDRARDAMFEVSKIGGLVSGVEASSVVSVDSDAVTELIC